MTEEAPKVLVVEDDEEIRSMMARLVGARGFRVVTSRDHGEAVEVARRERPRLIVTDFDLPTIKHLRESDELRPIPIVVVDPDSNEKLVDGRVIVVENFDQLKDLL